MLKKDLVNDDGNVVNARVFFLFSYYELVGMVSVTVAQLPTVPAQGHGEEAFIGNQDSLPLITAFNCTVVNNSNCTTGTG